MLGSVEEVVVANSWREHPKLKGRFHPDHPDDVQVIVHDGGPRITQNRAEEVWVTVTGMDDGDVFRGRVLNQPIQLRTVRQGSEIKFVLAAGSELPVMVTDKYLRERNSSVITPCQQCGFSELFDAPSDLMRVVFPKLPNLPPGAEKLMFTAFCPLCGGVQGVESSGALMSGGAAPGEHPPAKRPWWKFWG